MFALTWSFVPKEMTNVHVNNCAQNIRFNSDLEEMQNTFPDVIADPVLTVLGNVFIIALKISIGLGSGDKCQVKIPICFLLAIRLVFHLEPVEDL